MADQLPDLVLLDLVLPDISGFELGSRLRAVPGAAKTPILALTGLMAQADERGIGDAPFNDYLFKPVDPALLVSTLLRVSPKRTATGPDAIASAAAIPPG